MVDDVVTGDAVHARAEEARRALHAARRRAPVAPPLAPVPEPVPEPVGEADPEDDPRLRALVAENQALRAENAELRASLTRLRDDAGRALHPNR